MMKHRSGSPRFTRFSALLLISMAVLALFAGEAAAFLHRVGPINPAPPVGNYPAWYQDNTGLTLEFCDPKNDAELDGGWCLLARDAVGAPGVVSVPETFPTNFVDEHFYYSIGAEFPASPLKKILWEAAVEAAFAGDVTPGGQIVFSRIRMRLEDVPVTGTYRFIHPYGEEILDGVATERIFFTDDVGIGSPGDFSGAMTSRLGPFLVPSATAGDAELPPTVGPLGQLYLADPGRIGAVTGSPESSIITCEDTTDSCSEPELRLDRNFVRIEGPENSNLDGAGNDFIETSNFSLVGRIFTGDIPGEVTVDRANYYAPGGAGERVEVYATGLETTQGRTPGQGPEDAIFPVLSFFDAPCASALDNNDNPIPPYSAPAGAVETPMFNAGNSFWAGVAASPVPTAVCVKDSVSNAFFPKTVVDEITITEAYFDPNAQSLSVKAFSSDRTAPPVLSLGELGDLTDGAILVPDLDAPPSHVHVQSSYGGANLLQVTTTPPLFGAIPPDNVTLAASPAGSSIPGVNVTFQAEAFNGSGPYEYRFLLNLNGGGWVEVQPYSTLPTWTWDNTITVPPGISYVGVQARNFGSISPAEAGAEIPYSILDTAPTGITLSTDPTSPQPPGQHVTFTAAASGAGIYEYRFLANISSGGWNEVQPYSTLPTWTWDTTSVPAGIQSIGVQARRAGSGLPYEVGVDNTYTILDTTSTGLTFSSDPDSPQPAGTTVTFTAEAAGAGTYEYQFTLNIGGAGWNVVQPFSTLPTWTRNTNGATPGTDFVGVQVRQMGSTVVERGAEMSYEILAPTP